MSENLTPPASQDPYNPLPNIAPNPPATQSPPEHSSLVGDTPTNFKRPFGRRGKPPQLETAWPPDVLRLLGRLHIEMNISWGKMAEILDVSPATVYNWRAGKNMPIRQHWEHHKAKFGAYLDERDRVRRERMNQRTQEF